MVPFECDMQTIILHYEQFKKFVTSIAYQLHAKFKSFQGLFAYYSSSEVRVMVKASVCLKFMLFNYVLFQTIEARSRNPICCNKTIFCSI